jgi:two-component system CheB/CheR fusion protein
MPRNDRPGTEELLRLFAEQTKEHAILLIDLDGRISWWSAGAAFIFGIPSDEAVGRPFSELFTQDEVERGIADTELETARINGAAADDRWLERRDGSRFWATGSTIGIRDGEGRTLAFGKILRDRTDFREQVETLRNQAATADAASRRKDVFLSTLSHELRNPLAPLANAVQLIRMTAPPSAELEYPLKVIERQVESLRRLVDDLLDLTRIGAGKVELRRERLALQDVVHRAVESARALVRERRQRLEVLVPPSPMLVEGDASRLEQVLVNLLNNAAKYTPEGGNIWVKGTTEGDEAVLHIEDDGVGIPGEMLPHIFELFTQVDASRPYSQGGLGIGLSVVKNLVALHGGTVQVRSEGPGKGSEFTVRLPLSLV